MAKGNSDLLEEFPDVLPDTNLLAKKWMWKEDTNSLELVGNPGANLADKSHNLVSRNKKGKQGYTKVTSEGQKWKLKDESRKVHSTFGANIQRLPSPKSSERLKQLEDKVVTLDDVKEAAMDLLIDDGEINDSFRTCCSSAKFDDFLMILIYYFEAFLERLSLENKPKPMATEPSAEERTAIALQVAKQDTAKKLVAEKYGTLLLGLGMHEQHHLTCGRQRKSNTKMDRQLYETLYRFCVFVLWITFKRQELQLIEKEVGRLFRSDTFNPNSREDLKEEFKLAADLAKEQGPDFSLASASSARKQKRPAITSIINQRSPLIISLLPTSKDSSSWLLNRRNALLKDKEACNKCLNTFLNEDLFSVDNPRVGIIGGSFAGYNPITQVPCGEEHEDNASEKRSTSSESRVVFDSTEESSSQDNE